MKGEALLLAVWLRIFQDSSRPQILRYRKNPGSHAKKHASQHRETIEHKRQDFFKATREKNVNIKG